MFIGPCCLQGIHGSDIPVVKFTPRLSFPFDRIQDVVAVHQPSAGRVHVYCVHDQRNNRSFRFWTGKHRTVPRHLKWTQVPCGAVYLKMPFSPYTTRSSILALLSNSKEENKMSFFFRQVVVSTLTH